MHCLVLIRVINNIGMSHNPCEKPPAARCLPLAAAMEHCAERGAQRGPKHRRVTGVDLNFHCFYQIGHELSEHHGHFCAEKVTRAVGAQV